MKKLGPLFVSFFSLFYSKAVWPRKTQWFWHLSFPQFSSILIPNLFRASKKCAGALFRSFGSLGPLLRPRRKTQPTVVIGVRSATLFGQNGPGTREWCTFSKRVFLVVFKKSTLYVVFCGPPGAFGPLRAPSGGAPGAQQTDQGHDHFEASFRWCFVAAGGHLVEHQAANHDGDLCRMPSSRQACVHEPS